MADRAMTDEESAADWKKSGQAARRHTARASADQSRGYRESYEEGRRVERESRARPAGGAQRAARSQTRPRSPQRAIVGTMAFGVLFALVGSELTIQKGGQSTVRPITIMIGGGVATTILLVISHAGEEGAELAEGLAVVTMVTTVLVAGSPVWQWLSKLLAKPSVSPLFLPAPGVGIPGVATPTPNGPLPNTATPGPGSPGIPRTGPNQQGIGATT